MCPDSIGESHVPRVALVRPFKILHSGKMGVVGGVGPVNGVGPPSWVGGVPFRSVKNGKVDLQLKPSEVQPQKGKVNTRHVLYRFPHVPEPEGHVTGDEHHVPPR